MAELGLNSLDIINVKNLAEIKSILARHGCVRAIVKKLARNNNDKNQIYIHHDLSLLNSIFDLNFELRGSSTSKKDNKTLGKNIPSAVFNNFFWSSRDGGLYKLRGCKAITYLQYPETRLSGFATIEGLMPKSLSVEFTKANPTSGRYLVMGALRDGTAIGMQLIDPDEQFAAEFSDLNGLAGSKICKEFTVFNGQTDTEKQFDNMTDIALDDSARLKKLLIERVAGKTLKGVRLRPDFVTVPFNANQAAGYTLEHACGIPSNSKGAGDYHGIELKAFSRTVSLITTEPDGGMYKDSWNCFMREFGYLSGNAIRVGGTHRVNMRDEKHNFTMVILCNPIIKRNGKASVENEVLFDPFRSFNEQINGLRVVLKSSSGKIAASWSIEHLMNNWGPKHTEVVYVRARQNSNSVEAEIIQGYKKKVTFEGEVIWCCKSQIKDFIHALHNGTIFLQPAHKLVPAKLSDNKRRTQWRSNNIYKAVLELYASSEILYLC